MITFAAGLMCGIVLTLLILALCAMAAQAERDQG